MVLILEWLYFLGGLNSGVVLILEWSYFWGGLISGVVLILEWPYLLGGLNSGVVLILGRSYLLGGLKEEFHCSHGNNSQHSQKRRSISGFCYFLLVSICVVHCIEKGEYKTAYTHRVS